MFMPLHLLRFFLSLIKHSILAVVPIIGHNIPFYLEQDFCERSDFLEINLFLEIFIAFDPHNLVMVLQILVQTC